MSIYCLFVSAFNTSVHIFELNFMFTNLEGENDNVCYPLVYVCSCYNMLHKQVI